MLPAAKILAVAGTSTETVFAAGADWEANAMQVAMIVSDSFIFPFVRFDPVSNSQEFSFGPGLSK
jgi:hypothetical protein